MSSRRRLLEIIATSFKWLSQSFVNLYYSLIPTSISGKQVKDKARVEKIYGNSEVENQIINSTLATQTVDGITITNNNDGSFTLSGTASANVSFTFASGTWTLNHYYLFKGVHYSNNDVGWYDTYYGDFSSNTDFIFHHTNSSQMQMRLAVRIKNGTNLSTPIIIKPNVIDLTQRYPFDTPTTLDDIRVQAILNRGYLPYNTGTIKSVNMSELGSEPYNLFDEELEIGGLSSTNGTPFSSSNNLRSKNFIKVVGGKEYTLSVHNFSNYSGFFLYGYDENQNFIGSLTSFSTPYTTINATLPNNCCYVKIRITNSTDYSSVPTNPQVCFHRTGTRTGYAPHQFNIHLKSLLGKQNSLTKGSTSSSSSVIMMNNQVIYYGWTYGTNKFDITAQAHKYFIYIAFANPISKKFSMFIGINGNSLQSTKYWTNTNAKTEAYAIFDNTNSSISKIENMWLYANGSESYFNSDTDYPSQYFLLDLTRYGLQDLTDEQVRVLLTPEMINKLCNGETLGTIPFKYQGGGVGTSHDSLEITASEYVFTKDRALVDLGSLSVQQFSTSSHSFWVGTSSQLPNLKAFASNELPTILCPKYQAKKGEQILFNNTLDTTNGITTHNVQSRFVICDLTQDSTTSGGIEAFKQSLANIYAEYQLAIPQVIRIPKRHLGVVDLGSLDGWASYGTGGSTERKTTTALSSLIKSIGTNVKANIYCSRFLTITYNDMYGNYTNGIALNETTLYIKDNSLNGLTTNNDIKQALSGIYLFYETQDEVQDFVDEAICQAGGTVNGYWFSWVENQQLLLTGSNSEDILTTIENNCYVIDGTTTTSYKRFNTTPYGVVGHKYLSYAKIVSNDNNISVRIGTLNEANGRSSPITSGEFYSIFTLNNITNFGIDNFTSGTTFANFKAIGMLIDLTLGFPDGDIPTSINDPRIQEIIRLGYIPTDIQGTPKSITCEVLPNVDMEFKCK